MNLPANHGSQTKNHRPQTATRRGLLFVPSPSLTSSRHLRLHRRCKCVLREGRRPWSNLQAEQNRTSTAKWVIVCVQRRDSALSAAWHLHNRQQIKIGECYAIKNSSILSRDRSSACSVRLAAGDFDGSSYGSTHRNDSASQPHT